MNTIQGALTGWGLWIALVGACLGTYFCRAIGVSLSQRINQDSEIFRWLAAVTYAMVAALTVRLLVMPLGLLATVPLWIRMLICVLSIAVMMSRPTRRLVPALLTGTILMVSYGVIR
ncbi:AzlD domain-containing protein [Polynucleobacter sp. UK-Kesae-W10]|uniref:AzlD domain-containing protein n=1 Tax=Polynucleobacter sp. UK-Kesae-W10 TaxID=1819738 RepID=UPI001C0E6ADE|nr:AzlD domain-containing protein [Polynucleobacter sp. UK-Kesae-W10]MBU3577674.1 AzlD domain-containing protein [Polynucleobacter sp. UK-Kesae-W10]